MVIATTDVRYASVNQVWARYGELTRFLESARIALERERSLWASAEFVAADSIQIKSSAVGGAGTYKVRIDQHLEAVGDAEPLCGLVLLGTCAAAEELARIALGVDRLPPGGVEVWGTAALNPDHELADVTGGRQQIVAAFVARNAIAHGERHWTRLMAKRLSDAGGVPPQVGSKVEVAGDLVAHRASIRSFMRLTGLTTN